MRNEKNMNDDCVEQAREVLRIEAESITSLIDKVGDEFRRAVEVISSCRGRVIVTGLGKSGLIGKKIVATLTSTGTPALFLHPVEGLHGDLGIVTRDDVVLAISNSGETQELNALIDSFHDIGVPLIAFTASGASTLARASDIWINVGVPREACPFNLAPTSSSTAALAMGDALAVALVRAKNFTQEDFYKFHPGGSLGLRLLAKVREAMITEDRVPRVFTGSPIAEAVREMDEKNLGFVLVTHRDNRLVGILTDGDLRRSIRQQVEFNGKVVDDFMTRGPRSISGGATLGEAIEIMQKHEITTLVVLDSEGILEGSVHLHDILGRGGTIRMALSREE
ncbi:MAG: KpsF/GutQ family sugar-phosphate isomerase [Syntrophales bacterium]|nr:KpsF/GutQ family sugar-phosphate isomerase [Syntrophales bacterium]MCK9528571.1 KpsF/GutQ family sugar-phosphate isomerase [Syntrophales bacterium]MDX9922793.1 KpsF/GutQ family sugar-phosphate isomerase [Syntrophales bacterium]